MGFNSTKGKGNLVYSASSSRRPDTGLEPHVPADWHGAKCLRETQSLLFLFPWTGLLDWGWGWGGGLATWSVC